MHQTADRTENEFALAGKESAKHRIPKRARVMAVEPGNSANPGVICEQTTSVSPANGELCIPMDDEPKADEKVLVIDQIRGSQNKDLEPTPTQEEAPETRPISPSASGCPYGYGYLSKRRKGEGIPDACIECPKSLSCMLPDYYKKEENAKEISS